MLVEGAALESGKVFPVDLLHRVLIRLVQGLAVNDNVGVRDVDLVARQTDHAFDVMHGKVTRILEDDHIAAVYLPQWKDSVHDGSGSAIGKLVDQQVIPYEKVIFHGRGGDLKGLNNKGRPEQGQNDRYRKRFKVLAWCRFPVRFSGHFASNPQRLV